MKKAAGIAIFRKKIKDCGEGLKAGYIPSAVADMVFQMVGVTCGDGLLGVRNIEELQTKTNLSASCASLLEAIRMMYGLKAPTMPALNFTYQKLL